MLSFNRISKTVDALFPSKVQSVLEEGHLKDLSLGIGLKYPFQIPNVLVIGVQQMLVVWEFVVLIIRNVSLYLKWDTIELYVSLSKYTYLASIT